MSLVDVEWRRFRAAVGFLTRLPAGGRFGEDDLRGSILWFPAAGLVVGLAQGLAGYSAALALPPAVAAALALATAVAISGGLHLDGLMDTFDGLASGRPPEEALAVMRDSRVGACGVVAAVVVLLLQYAALQALLEAGGIRPVVVPAAAGMLARAALAEAVVLFPYRRPQGLGSSFRGAGRRELCGALVLAGVVAWAMLSWSGLLLLALVLGLGLAYGRLMVRIFGGLTGDTYGALVELAATALLVAALPILL